MPVSASIIARSSSSQPRRPAARIIAYSPETEYAASGTPNSAFAREMMSRYGSAGLTMTMSAPSSRSSAISRIASTAFAGSIWYARRSPNCGAESAASRKGPEQLERRVVADGAPLDDAAVPVARVLAQAHVGEDQQVRHHVLHRPHRLLHDAVLRVRLRAARVFLGGQTEQQHTGDPHARDVLHILHELVDGETELAGHRPDRLAPAAPVDDEQRVDEVINGQRGLADQLAEQRFLAETFRTEHRMRHHSRLRDRRPTFLGAREKYSASARARAGIVYSLGITSVGSPYSAAVAAVIGPIDATATRPRHARRSSSLKSSAKFRAVDELVNVTASTAPDASASRRRSSPFSTRRVW